MAIAAALWLLARSEGERALDEPRDLAPGVAVRDARPGELAAGGDAAANAGSAANASGVGALSSRSASLPASLAGTNVDGGFVVDEHGRFVPTRDALDVFDYYLAASGEEPPEVLRARIEAHIGEQLGGEAARDARALLDTYLGFREALRALTEAGAPPHDLERRLQWVRELRRRHFGADTAETLFGDEERALSVDLERRRVHADPTLDEAERAERLAALEAELPPGVRAARTAARAPTRMHREIEAMRAAGSSDAEIFAAREAEFGAAAAERLAALDAERAAWRARLDDYLQARDALLSEAEGDNDEERAAAVDALRRERFDEQERLRVKALEGPWPASG